MPSGSETSAAQNASMADLSDQIETQATKNKTVKTDGVEVTRRSISEQIEADRYLAEKAATSDMGATVKNMFSRIVPPGGH